MLTKEYREKCYKYFYGHRDVHLLTFALDDNHLVTARIILEDEISRLEKNLLYDKEHQPLYLDEFTFELHNNQLKRLAELNNLYTEFMLEMENKVPLENATEVPKEEEFHDNKIYD